MFVNLFWVSVFCWVVLLLLLFGLYSFNCCVLVSVVRLVIFCVLCLV